MKYKVLSLIIGIALLVGLTVAFIIRKADTRLSDDSLTATQIAATQIAATQADHEGTGSDKESERPDETESAKDSGGSSDSASNKIYNIADSIVDFATADDKTEGLTFDAYEHAKQQDNYIAYEYDADRSGKFLEKVSRDPSLLWSAYEDTVFLGDSIIRSLLDYALVDINQMAAEVGSMTSDIPELAWQVIDANPKYILVLYGLNEIDGSDDDAYYFAERLFSQLEPIRQALPNARIIILAITPCCDNAIASQARLGTIEKYNIKLREKCVKEGLSFCDCADLFYEHPEQYGADGIHFHKALCIEWMYQVAKNMHIYP